MQEADRRAPRPALPPCGTSVPVSYAGYLKKGAARSSHAQRISAALPTSKSWPHLLARPGPVQPPCIRVRPSPVCSNKERRASRPYSPLQVTHPQTQPLSAPLPPRQASQTPLLTLEACFGRARGPCACTLLVPYPTLTLVRGLSQPKRLSDKHQRSCKILPTR